MPLQNVFARFFGSHYTLFIVLTSNLSIFVNGMTMAWSSPVLVKLSMKDDNPLGKPITSQQSDLIGSLLFFSAAAAPLLFMRSSEILGRKQTIVLCLLPSLLGNGILVFARRVELYYLARILNGLTIGPVYGLVQSYLSEIIFSVKKRGPYLAINSPAIQAGILFAYIIGPYVPIAIFNAVIFFLTFLTVILITYGCPESPYFVLKSKDKKASLNILKQLDAKDVEKELMQIEEDLLKETQTSIFAVFKSKENMKPFVMATLLQGLQQFSGIGILMAYSQQIFMSSSEILPSEQCSILVGIIQLLSATTSTITSKKFPRKSLLIVSLLGSGFFDLILGLYFFFAKSLIGFNWIPLVALVLFVIFYNSGLDPIPWIFLGEVFPSHLKSVGTSAVVIINWILFSISTFAFTKFDVYFLFLAYSVSCFLGVFYVKIFLTETKDKTLREIQMELEK
ncbi:facilitated trehalose transporter Tret1-like isoform X2 [Harmonia axyridis]|uniref:facilitated trehalose transporter Tret1-like isoform X1 n=1 Tax=Harmonia axyridis TaxID=115357 RepID=UPI001E278570|nr:facilitated trehalose transporter Tret1-like isoform X1 [Harmonia axyridis]XP_045466222.1 facilitated trehalose transporter Tret1-like isoform X2 [Harmonia axyridis]